MLQNKALSILKSGRNVFLTGSAGTGKTYVLNQYIDYLKSRKIRVAITASTGIAATHMNGMTIHSWSGIGVKDTITSSQLASLKAKKYLRDQLEKSKVLIIDEISMLHKTQLDLVNQVLQYFKESTQPFGGIQVVLCGDFFQLPPIGNQGEQSRDKFSFMSEAWVKAELSVCYLTEQYRQNDNDLNQILNEIREGKISENSYQRLKLASKNRLNTKEEPTKLYTHNYDVDKINAEYLAKIPGLAKKFKAKTKGNKNLIDTLKNSVLAGEELELKIGAKVMFVKNNLEKGYVNGSLGTVDSYNDKGLPIVKLFKGKLVTVEPEDWTIFDDKGKSLANFNQIPLRLAWAITIHKCQGMTLDAAEIDLTKTFEKGQGYVALSRLKKIEHLHLHGLNEMALQVDALALKADVRFQELSKKVDDEYQIEMLEKQAYDFIKTSGGTLDKNEIKNNQKKLKEKQSKESTYDITLSYLKDQLPLKKIADIRAVNIGTITNHLIKIRKENPTIDLSFYAPKNVIIKKVEKVYNQQPKDKPVSLKAVYEGLNNEVSYDEIKLAIAFIIK
ncbi:MAG: AAA family ATPase [Flavobacteriales bacterium]|nr:AAA family ATPase [Flavobacteriales bacterium]